jgi:hypothetical protein
MATIMKTSHKSDELKKIKKRGGPQIGYLWFYIPIKLKPELAHASMTTSDVLLAYKTTKKMHGILIITFKSHQNLI